MRYAWIIAVLMGLLIPLHGSAEERAEKLSIDGFDISNKQVQDFMDGMALGVRYLNTTLYSEGKPMVYCPPLRGFSLTGNLLWELASRTLTGPQEASMVAMAAIYELKREHPCPKEQ